MNIEELRERVKKTNDQLDVPFNFDDGYERCLNFFNATGKIKDTSIYEINILEALKCFYYVQSKGNKTMDECNKFIDSFVPYFLVSSDDDVDIITRFFSAILKMNIKDDFIDFINEKNNMIAKIKIRKIIDSNYEIFYLIENDENKKLIELFEYFRNLNKFVDLENLLNAFIDDQETLEDITFIMFVYEEFKCIKDECMSLVIIKSFQKREKEKLFKEFVNDNSKIKKCLDAVNSLLNKIYSYILRQNKKEEEYYKNINKEKNYNLNALNMLERALKEDEIIKIRAIIKRISDKELKKDFLRVIDSHNQKYYERLSEQLIDIRKNSSTAYILTLKENGIEIGTEEIKELMNNSLEDINNILGFINNKFNFEDDKKIYILKVTNVDIINEIRDYIIGGYLSCDFVSNNISIFDSNSNYLNIIKNNISLISGKGINPRIFSLSSNLLLGDSKLISNNLDILSEYNLIKNIKAATDYLFLLDDKLVEKIDKYIELGYIQYLVNNLELLNCDRIDRLEVLNKMNYVISDMDSLLQIMNTKKFGAIDAKINDYIFNTLDYVEKENISLSEKQLKSRLINFWTYSFNGVLVSSLKVKRLLNNGFDLYDAIFYNMNLSRKEYCDVIDDIHPKQVIKY